jgi:hypothetical protein
MAGYQNLMPMASAAVWLATILFCRPFGALLLVIFEHAALVYLINERR